MTGRADERIFRRGSDAIERRFRLRAEAALTGCAYGDAMGMPTEMMSRERILSLFPHGIRDLKPSTPSDAFGRTLRAGEVTDDTVGTALLARTIIECGGEVDTIRYLDSLREWVGANPETARATVGPSTLAALRALDEGVPLEEAGRFGATNGGAMKMTPVGIVRSHRDMEGLVSAVERVLLPTHNTGPAISCAAAIAAAVSYAIRDGGSLDELWEVSLAAAEAGARRGHDFPSASIPIRMGVVRDLIGELGGEAALERISRLFGTGMSAAETAGAVFAIITVSQGDPIRSASLSAELGGDTDTIGALATAVCSALNPDRIPRGRIEMLEEVNGIDFAELAGGLAAVAEP